MQRFAVDRSTLEEPGQGSLAAVGRRVVGGTLGEDMQLRVEVDQSLLSHYTAVGRSFEVGSLPEARGGSSDRPEERTSCRGS